MNSNAQRLIFAGGLVIISAYAVRRLSSFSTSREERPTEKRDPVRDHDEDAMIQAAGSGYTDVVSSLVCVNTDVNAVRGGVTALLCAAAEGHVSTIAWLVHNKADVHARAQNGMTGVMGAAMGGHNDAVALIVGAQADVHAVDKNGVSALVYAAHGGHTEVVSWLIHNGADVDTATFAGETALMGALVNGHMQTAMSLVGARANVNAVSKTGQTPLLSAAMKGQEETVKWLIERNADVNARTRDGATALMNAAVSGHEKATACLLANGADVNAEHQSGLTAVMPLILCRVGRVLSSPSLVVFAVCCLKCCSASATVTLHGLFAGFFQAHLFSSLCLTYCLRSSWQRKEGTRG